MKLADLFEQFHPEPLNGDLGSTLPRSIVMPELQNNDTYEQYRYLVALAAAEAIDKGEIDMAQASPWNETTSVVCYTPAEEDIVKKTNKHMGVTSKMLSKTKSQEPKWVYKTSPVAKFKDLDK